MKISEAVARHKRSSPSVKDRVLAYVTNHADEVFTYRDEELLRAVGSSRAGLGFALWSLHKDSAIERYEHEGRAFFGTPGAVSQMRERLEQDDPWERARLLRQRIFERHGPINTLELLDEVRGPWD
jgi:hypothetical protein